MVNRMKLTRNEIETIVKSNEDKIHEIRQAIEIFRNRVQDDVARGSVVLGELYDPFKQMNSSLHRRCNDPKVIDLPAIVYSLQRLPLEFTTSYRAHIQKEPEFYGERPGIKKLAAKMRKRTAYDIGGEIEFIAREGESDIFDILCCGSMFGIESEKMRNMVRGSYLLAEINNPANGREKSNQILAKLANLFGVKFEDLQKANSALGYSIVDVAKTVVDHNVREMTITFDTEFSRTDASKKSREWNKRILSELREYGERPIALISSDNNSVVNCLTSFIRINEKEIVERASKYEGLAGVDITDPSIRYFILKELCKKPENKDLLEEKIAFEEGLGIKFLRDQHETGVDVHIIDLEKVISSCQGRYDSRLSFDIGKLRNRRPLILNMDYSFGKQGAHNMRGLCENLRTRLESISVVGKAGITIVTDDAEKFDIILPTYVVPQIVGGIYDFPTGNNLSSKDFGSILNGARIPFNGGSREIKVHEGGPILTVPGTAMQSDLLFYYYIYHDNILGVEMEAAPYFDSIEKAYKRGQLRKDIMFNVGYWASDNPLNPNETLAESHMEIGTIPSYALILTTLNKILNNGTKK